MFLHRKSSICVYFFNALILQTLKNSTDARFSKNYFNLSKDYIQYIYVVNVGLRVPPMYCT